jgi:hypothetical protein
VLSHEHSYAIHESCQTVNDDHPSRYWFGVAEVFFVRCPSEHMQAGSSGSALAILSPDEAWNLGGQIVAGGIGGSVQDTASGGTEPSHPLGQQLLLGNVPMLRQTLTIVYLQELIRRGMDPRDR